MIRALSHAIKLLDTTRRGEVEFKDPSSPLLEYLLKVDPSIEGQLGLNLEKIVKVIRHEIMTKRMYDRENPTFILCDQGLAKALGYVAFQAGKLEDILLPHLTFQPSSETAQPEPYKVVVPAIWGVCCSGRICLMAYHASLAETEQYLKNGEYFEEYPGDKDTRPLHTDFLRLVEALTPEDRDKIKEGDAVNFNSIHSLATDHLRNAPKAEMPPDGDSNKGCLIYDVSDSPLGQYFGTKVMSAEQLKGVLLYEWSNMKTSDRVLQVPRRITSDALEEDIAEFILAVIL